MVDERLVLTLNPDHLPPELEGRALRIGGVGGGQERGETIVECARREAREEAQVDVELVDSPRTFVGRAGESFREARCTDALRPVMVWSHRRADPRPYAPGLPAGPILYNALYLAKARNRPHPGDVEALLLVPPSSWPLLEQQPTITEAVAAGARLVERHPISPDTRLWLFPDETMGFFCEVAARDRELLASLG